MGDAAENENKSNCREPHSQFTTIFTNPKRLFQSRPSYESLPLFTILPHQSPAPQTFYLLLPVRLKQLHSHCFDFAQKRKYV